MSSAALAAQASEAIARWVPAMTLATGAILVAALGADRLLASRVSASVRLWLYGGVLLRLALPVGWHSPLGLLESRPPALVVPGPFEVSPVAFTPLDPPVPSSSAGWMALVYAAVMLALLGRWVQARLALRRRLAEVTPLGLAADGVPIGQHPRLGPLVAGLFRPRIVVPAALVEGPDREPLQWVLRHERAHVRRGDLPVGALVQLVCLFAWPILPVWIAARRVRALMELACDEAAVAGAGGAERQRYAQVLLALADPSRPALAPVLWFGWLLKGRLRALAQRRRWPAVGQVAAVSLVATLAFACAGEPAPLDDATVAPEVDARADTGPPAPASPPAATRPPAAPPPAARADGRFAPWVHIDYSDAIWLHTRRMGSIRIGDSQPLEGSLREALAETGSRAVLVEAAPSASPATIARVVAAAKRAGATDQAVTTMAAVGRASRPGAPEQLFRRAPGDPVVTVTRSRQLYLGPEHVPPAALEETLRRALARSSRRALLFQLDPSVDRGSIDDLMTVARRAGARDVAVQAEPSNATPSPSGPSKERIKQSIEAHSAEIRACYERHLQESRSDGGRLNFSWWISQTGEVSRVSWTGPALPELGACVRDVLSGMRFPPLEGIKGPLMVVYPFYFQSGR